MKKAMILVGVHCRPNVRSIYLMSSNPIKGSWYLVSNPELPGLLSYSKASVGVTLRHYLL